MLFILAFPSQLLYNNSSIKEIAKIIFTTLLILIFASIPFEKTNIIIFNFIKQITSYTGGIYCIHIYINSLLNNYTWSKLISKNVFKCIKHYFTPFKALSNENLLNSKSSTSSPDLFVIIYHISIF